MRGLRHERRPQPAARDAAPRPAGDRRPHPGLRLRLRARGGRPDRPRGGRGVRRRPTAWTRRPSPACWRWRTSSSASLPTCSTHPATAVGTVTSGGTESVLLAVQAARDARPDVDRPRMVLPATAHAAFHKAAHYFGVEAVMVDGRRGLPGRPGGDGRGDRRRTVLVVASAPSYAHGVVDPVTEIAGCRRGAGGALPRRRLHRRLGAAVRRPARPRRAAVDVRGRRRHQHLGRPAQVRLHPQGRLDPAAPHARRCAGRSSSPAPPGRATRCSTPRRSRRSPAARSPAAWAVVQHDRRRGLPRADRAGARRRRPAGGRHEAIDGAAGRRTAGLDAGRAGGRRDLRRLHDRRRDDAAGWYVQPQLSFAGRPADAAPLPQRRDRRRTSRSSSPRSARRRPTPSPSGPVRSTRASWTSSARSTPPRLSDEDFDGLLAAAGMAGGDGVGLPERMAEVNALLDLASPALREAMLIAFLDRLRARARVTRGYGR